MRHGEACSRQGEEACDRHWRHCHCIATPPLLCLPCSRYALPPPHLSWQIGYSTVFFWEYFGPLVVYPLFFFLPQYLYPHIK